MKTSFKRFIGVMLTMLMVVTMIPTITLADDVPATSFVYGGNTYHYLNKKVVYEGDTYIGILAGSSAAANAKYNYGTQAVIVGDRADGGKYIDMNFYPQASGSSILSVAQKGKDDYFNVFGDYLIPNTYEWPIVGQVYMTEADAISKTTTDVYQKASVVLPYTEDLTCAGINSGSTAKYIFQSGIFIDKNDGILKQSYLSTVASGWKLNPTYVDNVATSFERAGYWTSFWCYVTYVKKDFFAENYLDLEQMGENVKALLKDIFTRSDLSGTYSIEELDTLGILDDYTLESTNTPEFAESMNVGYKFTNNTSDEIGNYVILAVAYNSDGNIVGVNHIIPDSSLSGSGNYIEDTITITSSEVPSCAMVYALKSITDANPLTNSITIGTGLTSGSTAPTLAADISFVLNGGETKATFTVGGTLSEGKLANAIAIVTKPGKTLADLSKGNTAITDVILNINQVITDDKGKFVYDFTVPTNDLEYKKYLLSVYYGKTAPETDDVVYSDSDYDEKVMEDFTAMGLVRFFDEYSDILSLDTVLLGLLDNDELATAKEAVTTKDATATSLTEDINKQMAGQFVKKATTADEAEDAIGKYNHYLGIVFEGWLDRLKDEQPNQVYQKIADIKSLTSAQKLVEIYEQSVILAQINDINDYQEIETILRLYPERVAEYGIDLNKFEEYDENFPKALAKPLENEPYDIWNDFKDEFEDYESNGSGGGTSINNSTSERAGSSTTLVLLTTEATAPGKAEAVFADHEQAEWAEPYIEALAKLGYVNGKAGKNFCPNDNITREEVIKILVLALKLDISSTDNVFVDADPSAWYTPYLNAAYANGITQGSGDDRFGVGDNITREELATMIYRASKMLPSDTDAEFADDNEFSNWAKEAVYSLTAAGVINGKDDNQFAPKANATRAEASKIIFLAIVER